MSEPITIIITPPPALAVIVDCAPPPTELIELGWASPITGDAARELLGVYPASTTLSGSRLVNVTSSGEIHYADAAIGRPAHGFILPAVIAGESVAVYRAGAMALSHTAELGGSGWLGTEGRIDWTPEIEGRAILQEIGAASAPGKVTISLDKTTRLS